MNVNINRNMILKEVFQVNLEDELMQKAIKWYKLKNIIKKFKKNGEEITIQLENFLKLTELQK